MPRPTSTQVGGYYPTPLELIPAIADLVDTSPAYEGVFKPYSSSSYSSSSYGKTGQGEIEFGTYALLDPCGGDGEALACLASRWFPSSNPRLKSAGVDEEEVALGTDAGAVGVSSTPGPFARPTTTGTKRNVPNLRLYALEMEEERATSLKQKAREELDYFHQEILHTNSLALSYKLSAGREEGVSILYLNPPYSPDRVYGRLEQHFLEKFTGALVPGSGILVFVVPYYALSASASYLARHYEGVQCYRFPSPYYEAFSQVVLVARRRRHYNVEAEGRGSDWGFEDSRSSFDLLPVAQDPVAQQILTWATDPLSLSVLGRGAGDGDQVQPTTTKGQRLLLPPISRAGLEMEAVELDLTTLLKLAPVWQMGSSSGSTNPKSRSTSTPTNQQALLPLSPALASKGESTSRRVPTTMVEKAVVVAEPLYIKEVGVDKTLDDLLGRPYSSAMPPKPAHMALAFSSGAFNGKRIEPDGPAATGLPPLLVKGVFKREFTTVSTTKSKDGQVSSSVQIQQPLLEIYVLDLETYTYHRLKSGSTKSAVGGGVVVEEVRPTAAGQSETEKAPIGIENGAEDEGIKVKVKVEELTLGDLLSYYGSSLTELMATQFPAMHQPNNPAHQMSLPQMARPLYRAQHQGVQTMLKLLGEGETPIGASQPGTGKTGMSLAVAHALSPRHFAATASELKKTGHFTSNTRLKTVRRVLVLCPPINVATWRDEIPLWLPGAQVVIVEGISDLSLPLPATATVPEGEAEPGLGSFSLPGAGLTIYLLSREIAKLGHAHKAGATEISPYEAVCPRCGGPVYHALSKLASGRLRCTNNPARPTNAVARLAVEMAELIVSAYPKEQSVVGLTHTRRYLNKLRLRQKTLAFYPDQEDATNSNTDPIQAGQANQAHTEVTTSVQPTIRKERERERWAVLTSADTKFYRWSKIMLELTRLCTLEFERDPHSTLYYNQTLTILTKALIKVGLAVPVSAPVLAPDSISDPNISAVVSSSISCVTGGTEDGNGDDSSTTTRAAAELLLKIARTLFESGAEAGVAAVGGFINRERIGNTLRETALELVLIAQQLAGVNPLTMAGEGFSQEAKTLQAQAQALSTIHSTTITATATATTRNEVREMALALLSQLKEKYPIYARSSSFVGYEQICRKLARQYCQSWPVQHLAYPDQSQSTWQAATATDRQRLSQPWSYSGSGYPGGYDYGYDSGGALSATSTPSKQKENEDKAQTRPLADLVSDLTRTFAPTTFERENAWANYNLAPLSTQLVAYEQGLSEPGALLVALKELLPLARFSRPATGCGEFLYQATPQPRRYPLAKYILRYRKHFFDLFIEDEAHEYANEGTAQEKAANRLVSLPGVLTLPLSGSLTNGYPGSLFSNFWQWSQHFREEFGRNERETFISRYGYRKQLLIQDADAEKWARAGERKVLAYGSMSDREEKIEPLLNVRQLGVAPGVLPLFILQHLLRQAVIIHKNELEANLPPITEQPVLIEFDQAVQGDADLHEAARSLQKTVLDRIAADRYEKDMTGKLWGALAELPSYLDLCHETTGNATRYPLELENEEGEGGVGNGVGGSAGPDGAGSPDPKRIYQVAYPASCGGGLVATGKLFPASYLTPKERWLLDTLRSELAEGRRVIIFVRHTGITSTSSEDDGGKAKAKAKGTEVNRKGAGKGKGKGKSGPGTGIGLVNRLLDLCERELGEAAIFMDSSKITTDKRQDWLSREVVGKERRILILNPKTVKTGLNNLVAFNTAIWYELDYETITYTQANGRLHRPNQTKPVRIFFPVYKGTSQEVALTLLANKVKASLQVDGLDVSSALEAVGGGSDDERAASVAAAMSMGQAIYKRLVGTY